MQMGWTRGLKKKRRVEGTNKERERERERDREKTKKRQASALESRKARYAGRFLKIPAGKLQAGAPASEFHMGFEPF